VSNPRFPALKKDANGKNLCRGCGGPVPQNRQTWCSSKCLHRYHPQFVRAAVEKRDKCICSMCGIDTDYMREAYLRMCRMAYRRFGRDYSNPFSMRVHRIAKKTGWPADYSRDWWEADHIIPHSEGGQFVLENVRTLCVPCHKKRTKTWHRERKLARDPQLNLLT
jgi:5-methylcytosine-specific restriction protein A